MKILTSYYGWKNKAKTIAMILKNIAITLSIIGALALQPVQANNNDPVTFAALEFVEFIEFLGTMTELESMGINIDGMLRGESIAIAPSTLITETNSGQATQ